MDGKTDKNLHRLERKAIQEAEKRKKPGECLKVIEIYKRIGEDTVYQQYIQSFWCRCFCLYVHIVQYVQAIIDEDLTNEPIGSRILAVANIGHKLEMSVIPRTIYWQRSVQQTLKGATGEVRIL